MESGAGEVDPRKKIDLIENMFRSTTTPPQLRKSAVIFMILYARIRGEHGAHGRKIWGGEAFSEQGIPCIPVR